MTDTDNDTTNTNITDIEGLKAAKGRKLVFLNVRSLLSNINLLRAEFEHSNLLVIGICETWLTTRIHDSLIAIDGFNLVRHDRKLSKRGGGLLLYINTAVDFTPMPENLSCSDGSLEALTTTVVLPKQRNFIITLVYIPPSADKTVALTKLKQINNLISLNDAARVIAGDFNMDFSGNNKRHKDKAMLIDFQRSTNLAQTITLPTRTTNKTSSVIDLIFVSHSILEHTTSSITDYNVSDHDITYLLYKKEVIPPQKVTFSFRSKRDYNLAVLLHKFEIFDWSKFYAAETTTDCWNILYQSYLCILDSVAPIITKVNMPEKEEWLDDTCMTLLKKRDDLRKRIRYDDDNSLKQEFNKARNLAHQATDTARSNYVKRDLSANEKTPKKFWARLKILMPGKKNRSTSPTPVSLVDPHDIPFTDNKLMANFANTFFTNIGPQLASNITRDNSDYIKNLSLYINKGDPLLTFDPITETELLRLIKKIDTNKASNIDISNIDTKFFKHCMLCSLPQLTHLYNFVLFSSTIPLFWKSASVISSLVIPH